MTTFYELIINMRLEIEIIEAIQEDLNKIARILSIKQREMENTQGASAQLSRLIQYLLLRG
ncbi:MAG: hypothetical protein NTZ24_10540 [Deltaproteobacteria bacterium]|nr:hypothetical protein [Deltaproteobacteria bacterium]